MKYKEKLLEFFINEHKEYLENIPSEIRKIIEESAQSAADEFKKDLIPLYEKMGMTYEPNQVTQVQSREDLLSRKDIEKLEYNLKDILSLIPVELMNDELDKIANFLGQELYYDFMREFLKDHKLLSGILSSNDKTIRLNVLFSNLKEYLSNEQLVLCLKDIYKKEEAQEEVSVTNFPTLQASFQQSRKFFGMQRVLDNDLFESICHCLGQDVYRELIEHLITNSKDFSSIADFLNHSGGKIVFIENIKKNLSTADFLCFLEKLIPANDVISNTRLSEDVRPIISTYLSENLNCEESINYVCKILDANNLISLLNFFNEKDLKDIFAQIQHKKGEEYRLSNWLNNESIKALVQSITIYQKCEKNIKVAKSYFSLVNCTLTDKKYVESILESINDYIGFVENIIPFISLDNINIINMINEQIGNEEYWKLIEQYFYDTTQKEYLLAEANIEELNAIFCGDRKKMQCFFQNIRQVPSSYFNKQSFEENVLKLKFIFDNKFVLSLLLKKKNIQNYREQFDYLMDVINKSEPSHEIYVFFIQNIGTLKFLESESYKKLLHFIKNNYPLNEYLGFIKQTLLYTETLGQYQYMPLIGETETNSYMISEFRGIVSPGIFYDLFQQIFNNRHYYFYQCFTYLSDYEILNLLLINKFAISDIKTVIERVNDKQFSVITNFISRHTNLEKDCEEVCNTILSLPPVYRRKYFHKTKLLVDTYKDYLSDTQIKALNKYVSSKKSKFGEDEKKSLNESISNRGL